MRKTQKKLLLCGILACMSALGNVAGISAADIRILPIDTAKFWAGARFDFDVEVATEKPLGDVKIEINGISADKFFEKPLVKKDLGNGVTSFRVNDVTFK